MSLLPGEKAVVVVVCRRVISGRRKNLMVTAVLYHFDHFLCESKSKILMSDF